MKDWNDDLRGRRRSRASWKALVGEQAMRIRELEAAEARGRWRELKKDNLVTRLDGQLRESERRRRAMERQSEQRFLTPEELAETVVAKPRPWEPVVEKAVFVKSHPGEPLAPDELTGEEREDCTWADAWWRERVGDDNAWTTLHPKVRAQLGRVLREQGGSGKGSTLERINAQEDVA